MKMENVDLILYATGVILLVIIRAWRQRTAILEAIKSNLLMAVTNAEEEWGSGTGRYKLQSVYQWALDTFGTIVAEIITQEQLDRLVQKPLEEMRKQLQSNPAVAERVAPKNSVAAIGFEIDTTDEYDDEEG